jgi:hypothetical protein
MLQENTAVVRLLEWLEVKSVFHDFYNGAGDCFSNIVGEAGRPRSG